MFRSIVRRRKEFALNCPYRICSIRSSELAVAFKLQSLTRRRLVLASCATILPMGSATAQDFELSNGKVRFRRDDGSWGSWSEVDTITYDDGGGRTYSVPLQNILRGTGVSPNMFGARQDGKADDTAAILVAKGIAEIQGVTLRFSGGRDPYVITEPLDLGRKIDVIFEGRAYVQYQGPVGVAALTIGSHEAPIHDRVIENIDIQRAGVPDWSSPEDIGCRLIRCNQTRISIRRIEGFSTGLQLRGDGGGFAYCDISLGFMLNNQCGLDIVNANDGWVNENTLRGGRFTVFDVDRSSRRVAIRLRSERTPPYHNNSNLFIKPSIELHKEKTQGETIGFLFEHGSFCEIQGARDEGNDVFLRTLNGSAEIIASVSYSDSGTVHEQVAPKVEVLGQYPTVFVSNGRTPGAQRSSATWSSRPGNASWQFSSRALAFPGCAITTGSDLLHGSDGLTWFPDHLVIPGGRSSRGLVRRVDVRKTKAIVVRRDVDPNYPGRLCIRCLDENQSSVELPVSGRSDLMLYKVGDRCHLDRVENIHLVCRRGGRAGAALRHGACNPGDLIEDGEAIWEVRPNPVRFGRNLQLSALSQTYSNSFTHQSDRATDVVAFFESNVAYADIIVSGGTSDCHLRGGFSIEALNGGGPLASFHPLGIEEDQRYAIEQPDGSLGGFYPLGQFIRNARPASTQPIGWYVLEGGEGRTAKFITGPRL